MANTLQSSGVAPRVDWNPNRDDAINRLRSFVPHMADVYRRKRNDDEGPERRSNVSLLSPWIRHRLILETEVIDSALGRWSLSEADKFVQEVAWRGYFKGWLEHYPQVWENYRRDLHEQIQSLETDNEIARRYESATTGATGIECFDAWVRELVQIGYLHNHARMWFASIWIFTLELPWQLGADFFYRHLLDGDPASNTLSWRWVAGLHTKGKTYLARPSNIAKYSGGRFRVVRDLARDARPLVEPDYGQARTLDYSAFDIPATEFGLLVTTEDCSPETLPLPRPPVTACGLGRLENHMQLKITTRVSEFSGRAVDDALFRVHNKYDIGVTRIDGTDWCEQLIGWAQAAGINAIVTAYVPLGPTREALDKVKPLLEQNNIKLYSVKRAYDNAVWPFTKKGFFALKKQLPSILKSLHLTI